MTTTLISSLRALADSNKAAELPLVLMPQDVQESILMDCPLCETVSLTVFSNNKGERFYMASAKKGSRDGFPIVTRRW